MDVELTRVPATRSLYRKAVRGSVRRRDEDPDPRLPDTRLLLRGVEADIEQLSAYDRVCGFRLADTLPVTYPHVLAFPLAMRVDERAGVSVSGDRPGAHREPDHAGAADPGRRAARLRGTHRVPAVARRAVGSSMWSRRRPWTASRCGTACPRTCGGTRRSTPRPSEVAAAEDASRPVDDSPPTAIWPVGSRHRPGVRRGLRRPQSDPSVAARRAGIRFHPPDRARHVDHGPLRRRLGRQARRTRTRSTLRSGGRSRCRPRSPGGPAATARAGRSPSSTRRPAGRTSPDPSRRPDVRLSRSSTAAASARSEASARPGRPDPALCRSGPGWPKPPSDCPGRSRCRPRFPNPGPKPSWPGPKRLTGTRRLPSSCVASAVMPEPRRPPRINPTRPGTRDRRHPGHARQERRSAFAGGTAPAGAAAYPTGTQPGGGAQPPGGSPDGAAGRRRPAGTAAAVGAAGATAGVSGSLGAPGRRPDAAVAPTARSRGRLAADPVRAGRDRVRARPERARACRS